MKYIFIPKMANNSVNKLIQRSIQNNTIKQEKDLIITFLTDPVVSKTLFGDVLSLPDSYGIEEFNIYKI